MKARNWWVSPGFFQECLFAQIHIDEGEQGRWCCTYASGKSAMGLRVAGTCGINSLSLSSSICNPAILCCVKSKLWQDLILPPPSLPTLHALSILQWWWQIVFSFASLLCAVAYHVDWPVLPLLWQNKMKKPWHYYPTFKMCLHSHPCSDGFPELLKPHRVVSMSRRCTN